MDRPERSILTDDGVRIAYRDVGPKDGAAVALCHGICAAGQQFDADANHFAALGYRVIVPDLRAHGASGIPKGPAADFSIARLAADMHAVLDDAEVPRVHWLGNSLGGIAGLAMLAQLPSRFASFATFGTAYRLALPRLGPPMLPLLYKSLGPTRLGRITAAMTTGDTAARKLIAGLIASFDSAAGERIAEHLRAYDLTHAAQQFPGPILVIRGARDRAVNLALGRTFAAMRDHPNFRRIDLARAGHCANLDAPAEVRAILDAFWQEAGALPVPAASALSA